MLLNKYYNNNLTIYLFSISLDMASTNLPYKGSFIPLIKYLINDDKLLDYYYVDTKLKSTGLKHNSKIINPNNQSFIYNSKNSDITLNIIGYYDIFNNDRKIDELAKQISSNIFKANPTLMNCTYCDYKKFICSYYD